jgi:hypothetical protein
MIGSCIGGTTRFPICGMRLLDRYGAVDMRSMKADKTSASVVATPAERAARDPSMPTGMRSTSTRRRTPFHDRAWWAFHAIGWHWGESWDWPTDYQHFSATHR